MSGIGRPSSNISMSSQERCESSLCRFGVVSEMSRHLGSSRGVLSELCGEYEGKLIGFVHGSEVGPGPNFIISERMLMIPRPRRGTPVLNG